MPKSFPPKLRAADLLTKAGEMHWKNVRSKVEKERSKRETRRGERKYGKKQEMMKFNQGRPGKREVKHAKLKI
jgi:hypothetical protein